MIDRLGIFAVGVIVGICLCLSFQNWYSSSSKIDVANKTTQKTIEAVHAAAKDEKELNTKLSNNAKASDDIQAEIDKKLSQPVVQESQSEDINHDNAKQDKVTCAKRNSSAGLHAPALTSGDSLMPFDDDTIELLNKARVGSPVRSVTDGNGDSAAVTSTSKK